MKTKSLLRFLLLFSIILGINQEIWGQTYLINESFESSFPPTGWTNNGCIQSGNNPRTGIKDLGLNGVNDEIITSQLTNPDALSFWYKRSSNSTAWTLKVYYGSSTSGPWTEIGSITNATTTYQEFTYSLSGLNNIYLRFLDQRGTGTHERYIDDVKVTEYASVSPTITINPTTLSGFTYITGNGPSSEQSFSISGSNLTHDISIAATTNYEISTGTGGSFSATSPITLSQSGGAVASTPIYVRLKAGLSIGTYNSEAITASSTDADDATVTASGSVTAGLEPANQPTTFTATTNSTTQITLTWSNNDGSPAATGFLLLCNTSGTFDNPVDGTPQTNDTDVSDGSGLINVSPGSGTTEYSWTSMTSNTAYYFKVFPFIGSLSSINYKTDGTVATANATTLAAEPTNQPTLLETVVNSSSSITLSWTDATGGQLPHYYLVKAAAGSAPTAPSDGIAEADADLVKNIAQGVHTVTFTGLTPETTYSFAIWPYTNSSTAINYKTDGTVLSGDETTGAVADDPKTVNFDDAGKWSVGTSGSSYGNYSYTDQGVSFQGTSVIRNTTTAQDGFPGALGTYAWRLNQIATTKLTITIASGGVNTWSFKVRRWDATPAADYTVKYSVNGGNSYTSCTNINSSLLTTSDWFTYEGTPINDASNNIIIEIQNTGTTERIMIDDFTWTASTTPAISVSTTSLSGYTYNYGAGPSAEQSFTVSGINLSNDISIAPPTNYEISTGTGGSFSATNPIVLTQTGGTVSSTTIYTRLKAGLAMGDYNSENVTASSTGATSKTVSLSGTVTTAPEPSNHPTSFTATTNTSSQITVSWTNNDGAQAASGYLVMANTTGTFTSPVDGTAQSDDIDMSDDAGVKNVSPGATTSEYVWQNLDAATTYYFKVFAYNGSSTAINYKTDVTVPTANATTLSNYDNTSTITAPAAQISAGSISSLVDTQGEAVAVFKFKITDAGGDATASKITKVKLVPAASNTADWSNHIQGAYLHNGTGSITPTNSSITDTYVELTINSADMTIAESSNQEFTVYLYLNTSNISDGSVLSMQIAASHGFTTETVSSGFESTLSGGAINSADQTISVVATQFNFTAHPSNTNTNTNFAASISASDANGNLDLNGSISATLAISSGTLTSATGLTQSTASGVYSWSDLQCATPGTGLTLTVSGAITSATSNSFNLTSIPKIFFSEYIEGSSNNKAVEIFNGEATSINLANIKVKLYANGASSAGSTITLNGTLASGGTYVIYNSSAGSGISSVGQLSNGTVMNYNGDDAIELLYNDESIDVIGIKGNQPSTGWAVAGISTATANRTLVRKQSVTQGTTNWATSTGSDAATSQWLVKTVDDFNYLGYHYAVWQGTSDNAWATAGNWKDSDAPGNASKVVIPADATSFPTLSQSTTFNELIIESGATLIGTEHLTLNVSATQQRSISAYTAPAANDGWHLMAAPMSNADVDASDFTSGTYDLYRFDEVNNTWKNQENVANAALFDDYVPGIGYLYATNSTATKNFTGQLNAADVTISGLSKTADKGQGWHLLGNPFPANLVWRTGWTLTNIGGTAQVMKADGTGYAPKTAGDIIAANQGFFVQVSSAPGSLTIPIAAATHNAASFSAKTSTSDLTARLFIDETRNVETRIIFNSLATNDFDWDFDANYLAPFNADMPKVYTLINDSVKLALNAMDFSTEKTIPIVLQVTSESTLVFKVDGMESLPVDIDLLLHDYANNQIHNLTNLGQVNLLLSPQDETNRFALEFKDASISNPEISENQLDIYSCGDLLILTNASDKSENARVSVYNLAGQLLIEENVSSFIGERQIQTNLPASVYLVKVNNGEKLMSKRVFIN
ncbi:MAG: fibronectin type III domain-containing protein [Bacteroidales bacterium]|nr:fibronectin type III domain-containing protein [Bacteroidales bacterium]